MATLTINVSPQRQVVDSGRRSVNLIVKYERLIRAGSEIDPAETAPAERQFPLSEQLSANLSIDAYAQKTPVGLSIADAQGFLLVELGQKLPEDNGGDTWKLSVSIADNVLKEIEKATATVAVPQTPVFAEMGEFKPITAAEIPFRDMLLVVAPVKKASLPPAMLKKYLGEGGSEPSAALDVTPNRFFSDLKAYALHSVSVSIQGLFEFRIPVREGDDCWLWVLSGASTFGGLVADPQKDGRFRRVLWLPIDASTAVQPSAGSQPASCGCSTGIPVDPSEQELVRSPGLFADDPGTRCKPFSSPNRIVGEKSFHTVLRVTQPEISADAAAPKPPRPKDLVGLFELDATDLVMSAARLDGDENASSQPVNRLRRRMARSVLGNLAKVREAMTTAPSASTASSPVLTPEAELVAAERADVLRKSVGRRILSSAAELDWDDMTPAQASSLAFGHILDHRVRWRSNGYSLGDVLYSLALAPRQTKKILTVHSEIRDRATRREVTSVSEQVSQATTKDYSYADAVQAGLSEWSKGGSSTSTTGAAGGFGMAIGPVVLGGGASHGRAESDSWQEGGRKVSALEEQSLRDAIRQYGDSLRKLESVIIQEQTQEETTQAVSEIVRNPNYCHSLTIIYHQILRHLRVDTETVGARECVFVPLPISPFTWSKMIRWRDALAGGMLDSSLRWVMNHLEDVQESFAHSEIAAGPRADQPIRFLSGSIHLQLAVERPADGDSDAFDPSKWIALSSFIGRPVREVYERLKQQGSQMDQIFQAEFAPEIAAKWIDKLLIKVGGGALNNVDMTLATRYGFNRTVRVDFTCVPDKRITRRELESFSIEAPATAALTPGSVANVKQASIRYYTADFDRSQSTASLTHDLVSPGDGSPQAGANLFLPIDDWEKVDQREYIRVSALKLRQHLNEHLEYYHKHLWRTLDLDKLYMLLDTIYVISEADGRSVASVVERNPIAILGNSLVYRVAAGAHLGIDGHKTAADLNAYYRNNASRSEPIRVSLPTAGVYAQAILDDCEACEEHFGSTEWILNDKEPELADLDPSLLSSRRAAAPNLSPTPMPASIINLQNAPNAPTPSGFGGVFDALTRADAFRDMAGLEGTQANARAAMESATSLASQFGTQAAEIRKAEIAAKIAKEKLGVIDKAEKAGAVSPEVAQKNRETVLDQMNAPTDSRRDTTSESDLIDKVQGSGLRYKRSSPDGDQVEIQPADLSTLLGEFTGDPDAVILAKGKRTANAWGTFGKEWARADSSFFTASEILLKSPTFHTRASALGKRYRSLFEWRQSWFGSGAAFTVADAEYDRAEKGTYKGDRFLSIELGNGGAFLAGAEMFGFGDVIQFGRVEAENIELELIPQVAHEVSHAFRATRRKAAANMGDAIIQGIDEEIEVRKDELKILNEIERATKIRFNAVHELRPGNVEREVAPGIGVSYLEAFVVDFLLEEARKAGGQSRAVTKDLRKAAEATFPSPPVDQSEYSKMYFKRLRLKKSWKDFHAATPETAADYIDKRNLKCDEHMKNILDNVAMYRMFEL